MKKYISLYLYNIKVFMMAQMSFRVDFFIGLFSSLIEQIVYLIFLNILFGNIKEIAGFNYGQMLFIYGIATVVQIHPVGYSDYQISKDYQRKLSE